MTRRIYVACLASYNAGILYGKWIDATADVAEMNQEIQEMLAQSPEPNVMRQKYRDESGDLRYVDIQSSGIPETWEKEGEPFRSAEEYAIHDHEGLGNIGEYAGLQEVARRVEIGEAADNAVIPDYVLLEAMEGYDAADPEEFISDCYAGTADSWEDFAREFEEETGGLDNVPERFKNYIDFEAIGRDMRLNGDLYACRDEESGNLHFFWNR